MQINKQLIDFVSEAAQIFSKNAIQETYRDYEKFPGLMALRMGLDRDCVEVHRDGHIVANFVQMMEPMPYPEGHVLELMFEARKQSDEKSCLFVIDHEKGLLSQVVSYSNELQLIGRSTDPKSLEIAKELSSLIVYCLARINDVNRFDQ